MGATSHRLSFFVMVFATAAWPTPGFACGEAMNHFLACQHNALGFCRCTPGAFLIDNLKTGFRCSVRQ